MLVGNVTKLEDVKGVIFLGPITSVLIIFPGFAAHTPKYQGEVRIHLDQESRCYS
jgi:hypothetical protein